MRGLKGDEARAHRPDRYIILVIMTWRVSIHPDAELAAVSSGYVCGEPVPGVFDDDGAEPGCHEAKCGANRWVHDDALRTLGRASALKSQRHSHLTGGVLGTL